MVYKRMANVYDILMKDAPYDQWIQFTENLIQGRNIQQIADLGCGTGEVAIKLAKKGYQVTGVDYAVDMLTYAEHKSSKEKLPIQWICQDLRHLDGLQYQDLVISYCDVINYITTESELRDTFKRIYHALKPAGLFLFDVHAISFITNHYINETFAEVNDEASYIWFCNEGEQPGEMHHELTFFMTNDDGISYSRFDEDHYQRTFSIDFYKNLLMDAGFKNIKVYGDFSVKEDNITKNTARIFFSVEKSSE
ncbi:class I SAM-dependent DNA methyltransferase [Virgibacillus salexigens]|nr:class I SAM-dependent methyltransferase [Virgibacillus kapii]